MNKVDEWRTVAIATNPDSVSMWRRVFGINEAPITSVVPQPAYIPGKGEELVYWLDMEAISEDQRERLVQVIAKKFNVAEFVVMQELEETGLPILAEHVVTITTSNREIIDLVLFEKVEGA